MLFMRFNISQCQLNSLYLVFNNVDAYIEENSENKV